MGGCAGGEGGGLRGDLNEVELASTRRTREREESEKSSFRFELRGRRSVVGGVLSKTCKSSYS